MNVVVISGRLTKNPELRSTATGMNVCSFNLAVKREKKDEVDFIECVCFSNVAENLVKFQTKGDMVEVKGRLQNDRYTNKDGKNVYRTLIYVEMINYISSNKTTGNEVKNSQKDPYLEMSNRINSENDLPF